jgi:high affinity Mn2+ porin
MKLTVLLSVLCLAVVPCISQVPDNLSDSTRPWDLHCQTTAIQQFHPPFHAAYGGTNSLDSTSELALTMTGTLFAGCRLWQGGSVFFNPEIAGGKGFTAGYGIAGFPNGEVERVGDPSPNLSIARLFLRQRINLGDKTTDTLTDDVNQVWEKVSPTNLTFTAGKIALPDIFDNNRYSHDPRMQFFNWSLMDAGAWDYPADTRGYTYAFVTEFNRPTFSLRGAISSVSTVANGPNLEFAWGKAAGYTFEAEYRDSLIKGHPGTLRALLYDDFNRAGNYDKAVSAYENDTADKSLLDVDSLNHFGGKKAGFDISADQEITSSLGAFLRVSWNDGNYATWEFAEIDRSVTPGISLSGSLWNRNGDNAGLAVAINGISAAHRRFLEAGGLGFILGDGKLLNYGTENILEAYYQARVVTGIFLTADYQLIVNPAYNEDRGPVNVISGRVHVEF